MSLRDLTLAQDYRSNRSNLVDDFYIPCFTQSVEYLRAVGYFTSRGLALASKGLSAFIARGGRMRLVASPLLVSEDIEAFKRGYEARKSVIEGALLRQLSGTDGYSEITRHRQRRRLDTHGPQNGGRIAVRSYPPGSWGACPELAEGSPQPPVHGEPVLSLPKDRLNPLVMGSLSCPTYQQ